MCPPGTCQWSYMEFRSAASRANFRFSSHLDGHIGTFLASKVYVINSCLIVFTCICISHELLQLIIYFLSFFFCSPRSVYDQPDYPYLNRETWVWTPGVNPPAGHEFNTPRVLAPALVLVGVCRRGGRLPTQVLAQLMILNICTSEEIHWTWYESCCPKAQRK